MIRFNTREIVIVKREKSNNISSDYFTKEGKFCEISDCHAEVTFLQNLNTLRNASYLWDNI